MATDLPWTGYDENSGFDIVGREKIKDQEDEGRYHAASPGYFEALAGTAAQGAPL